MMDLIRKASVSLHHQPYIRWMDGYFGGKLIFLLLLFVSVPAAFQRPITCFHSHFCHFLLMDGLTVDEFSYLFSCLMFGARPAEKLIFFFAPFSGSCQEPLFIVHVPFFSLLALHSDTSLIGFFSPIRAPLKTSFQLYSNNQGCDTPFFAPISLWDV